MAAPAVALPRTLHLGCQGIDVVAAKRALSRAGFMQWGAFTDVDGPYMTGAVQAFQAAAKLLADGIYGPATHAALEKTHRKGSAEWAFDSTAVADMKKAGAAFDPETLARAAIVSAGFYWYAHRYEMAYSEARPIELVRPPQVPTRADCSGWVTCTYWAGGAPDPNQRGYSQPCEGYTGTLLNGGAQVQESAMKPGDLMFWGHYYGPESPAFPPGSPTHVSLFTSYVDGEAMTLSNGVYPMQYLRAADLAAFLPLNQCRTYPVA